MQLELMIFDGDEEASGEEGKRLQDLMSMAQMSVMELLEGSEKQGTTQKWEEKERLQGLRDRKRSVGSDKDAVRVPNGSRVIAVVGGRSPERGRGQERASGKEGENQRAKLREEGGPVRPPGCGGMVARWKSVGGAR